MPQVRTKANEILRLRRHAICQIAWLLKQQTDISPSALMGVGDFYIELSLLDEMEEQND